MNSFKQNDDGFTGLEAAIVLIAFVVVAAVFSYVVLGAGFFTTQKAQETVYQGVAQSTTNILLKGSIYGDSLDSKNVVGINMTLGLAPGAPAIDLSTMKIVYSTSTISPIVKNWTGTLPPVENQFYSASSSMSGNDQVNIFFGIPPAAASTVMHIEIRPPGGGAVIPFTLTVPATVSPINILH
jgi:flagellin FlaB